MAGRKSTKTEELENATAKVKGVEITETVDAKDTVIEPIKKEPVKEEVNPTVDDTLFEYICDKSGMYKIYLNEGEKLVIKD